MQGEVFRFSGIDEFDPDKVFDCGQSFRFIRDERGVWSGIAGEYPVRLWREGEDLLLLTTGSREFWRDYLDLDRDYRAIRESLAVDQHMEKAAKFGKGIRILRQEPWEALVTFIFSQCNNIPRIRGLVERLAALLGEKTQLEGEVYYTFPKARDIASLTLEDLAPVRAGFRTKYVLEAARAVDDGTIDLQALKEVDGATAVRALKSIRGVGEKVASCVALFGLHHLDAFPVDVWMKRTIASNYAQGLDPAIFGQYAGLAQQYLFYYAKWQEGLSA